MQKPTEIAFCGFCVSFFPAKIDEGLAASKMKYDCSVDCGVSFFKRRSDLLTDRVSKNFKRLIQKFN
jgi:hypothetical protein